MRTKHRGNRSVMKKDFGKLPSANIRRSTFNRSHSHKTGYDSGYLIPIYVDEVLPGDSLNLTCNSLARIAPRVVETPFMDNIRIDYFFFAVPNRLLWTNWQRFMGERDPDPDSSTDYTVPLQTTPSGGHAYESLADYMGIPPEVDNLGVSDTDLGLNALHFRAYNLIYNSWFRDSNLQDSVKVDLGDGPDTDTDYVLLRRGKRKDYFTSCLPWPQVGTEVDLPLGERAPVAHDAANSTNMGAYSTVNSDYHLLATPGYLQGSATSTTEAQSLYTDLSTATAASINSIREAFQLQRLLERDARSGARYVEILQAHFNVTTPDQRFQRPEYLGGGSAPIKVNAIATSASASTALGTLGGIGYHQARVGFTKSFVEHCVIIGIACATCDLSYQHGLRKMWTRQTKYDYYWPSLAGLGEQEVLNREIFAVDSTDDTGATGTPDNERVWGYQERYAEYRHMNSIISGALRSTHGSSLDAWHLAIDHGDPTGAGTDSAPPLNADFIEENPPIYRVISTGPYGPEVLADHYFQIYHTRPLPTYGIPGMIDHF